MRIKLFALCLFLSSLGWSQGTPPVWTYVANTPITSDQKQVFFDRAGVMYVMENTASDPKVYRSIDKGLNWQLINNGFDTTLGCGGSFLTLSLAPDGTVFGISYNCYNASPPKNNYAYWLNNVSGDGTTWTKAPSPFINYQGVWQGCGIAPNGNTIICPTGGQYVFLSDDQARTWRRATTEPPFSLVAELQQALTVNGVAYIAAAINSSLVSGSTPCCAPGETYLWYSLDNGETWASMGMPSDFDGCYHGSPTHECLLDVSFVVTRGIQLNDNIPMIYTGNTGVDTAWWGWTGGTFPMGTWTKTSTGQWSGNYHGAQDRVTWAVNNPSNTRQFSLQQVGNNNPAHYTDDGYTWVTAMSGLTCTDCGIHGLPKMRSIGIDPTTGIAYMGMANGEVWKTTTSQDVTDVSVTPAASTVAIGDTLQLTPTYTYVNATTGSDCPIASAWHSDNTSIATVSSTGLVAPLSPGIVHITDTCEIAVSNQATVIVTSGTLTSVTILPTMASISTIGKQSYDDGATTPVCKYSDGSTDHCLGYSGFSSDNPAVATVDASTGVAIGVAVGTAHIRLNYLGVDSNSATLDVLAPRRSSF